MSDFNETNFLERFSKNTKLSNFTKIRPVRAEFFHSDGQTDMTKLTVAFLSFAYARRNFGWTDKFGYLLPVSEKGTQNVRKTGN